MVDSEINYANAIVASAGNVVSQVGARAVMFCEEAVPDLQRLVTNLDDNTKLIVIRRGERRPESTDRRDIHYLYVPDFKLTRMDQIKMATVLAFSQGSLGSGDTFVALTGVSGKPVDTMVVMCVGHEYELFDSVDQPKLTEHVRRVVFQRVLNIAIELAQEGREGKSVGAIFVIGNVRELQKYINQHIINPFRGYQERERNILDDHIKNTIKEFCAIDGAFIIKGNGVIVSAGTTLRPDISGDDLPQGLGARHAAAAAITASTRSLAVTVSESTGTVRLWRRGKMIIEIEKATRPAIESPENGSSS